MTVEPEPLASTQPMSCGRWPLRASASTITSFCAWRFGVAGPAVRPSLLIAMPLSTASTWSPSACALASGFRTTTPTPSPSTRPAALRSNTWNSAPGLSSPRRPKTWWARSSASRLTPATTAVSMSPVRSAWVAMSIATRAEEQAVSTTTLGPRKSKNCETLAER